MLTTNSLRLRPYNNRQITRILVLILALTTQLQNCQTHQQQATTHGNGDCSHRHHLRPQQHQQVASGASRQQRQFSPRMAQMVASTLPASNPIMKTVELEHEEFNLGASNQQANLSTGVLQQQIATHREDSQLRTATDGATNTTPAQPNDSIGSPVAPQPPVTTSSSLLASNSTTVEMSSTGQPPEVFVKENSQVHARPAQQARQMPDREAGDGQQQQVRQPQYYGPSTESSSSTGHFSHSENNHHMVSSLAQSVSSSPSSISIITPLMSAPDQHQKHQPAQVTQTLSASIGNEQSTGMMKPIFVVGNPISERDYAGPHYETSAAASQLYQPQPVQGQPQLATSPSLENSKPAAGLTSNMIPKVRMEKLAENQTTSGQSDRIDGPPLVYSDGQLTSQPVTAAAQQQVAENGTLVNSAAMPRLLQPSGAAVLGNNLRRPSLPPPVNQANAASGFRSPMSPSGSLVGTAPTVQPQQQQQQQVPPMQQQALQPPANNMVPQQMGSFYQSSAPYAGVSNLLQMNTMYGAGGGANGLPTGVIGGPSKPNYATMLPPPSALAVPGGSSSTAPHTPSNSISYSGRRPLNITRVEHISAECSDDLIRAAIVFNGTFKGIIYSSGYVNDPTCLYVNGTGATRYEFGIRLNQCGTLGRQELHQPTIPGEARRRDQVMWNTLSIQYNSIIEQEWDEHFRVSCEYGSDFWKTVSFSPFNVETNTGSPVVFTINPPQCQMDVLLGHGMGPKIAVDGPVTVGDPLTLLIHMKSEKAGYDILVKNCVAHNGGKQRMQLIDSNGCVVNERFISPFRGTYNDNDLRHVTLYAYLKAFRFTGSPVLYLECEIHMCQSACPPQMCYWRRLSKRSVDQSDYEYTTNQTAAAGDSLAPPVISDSLNLFKALQVRQESEPSKAKRQMQEIRAEDEEATLVCYRHTEVLIFLTTIASLLVLVITIAVTCCLRVRKLSRRASQLLGDHKLLGSTAGSLSPSLLSISDALCNASTLSGSLLSLGGQSANDKSLWLYQKQHRQRPTCPIADRSPVSQSNRRPPSSSFHHGQPQAFNSPRAR